MKYDEFKSQVIGKIVDDGNGTYNGQCVSLVKRWISFMGWPYKRGNAIDWQNNGDDFYRWTPNTPSAVPAQGDIIVFKTGTYGHIGVVESANVNTVDVLNQNYPKGNLTDPVQVTRFNYVSPKVIGWLHPVALDTPSTPPPPAVDPKDVLIADLQRRIVELENRPPVQVPYEVDRPETLKELENARAGLVEANKTISGLKVELQNCIKTKKDLFDELDLIISNNYLIKRNFISNIITSIKGWFERKK